MRTDDEFDGVVYQVSFATKKEVWTEETFAFDQFVPTCHGRVLRNVGKLDPAKITSVGLLIADKQAGLFQLEIEWIKTVQSAGR